MSSLPESSGRLLDVPFLPEPEPELGSFDPEGSYSLTREVFPRPMGRIIAGAVALAIGAAWGVTKLGGDHEAPAQQQPATLAKALEGSPSGGAPDQLFSMGTALQPHGITTSTRLTIREAEKRFGCELQHDLTPDYSGSVYATESQQACAQYVAKVLGKNTYQWGNKDFKNLVELWQHESNWSANQHNPNSAAFGIPQAMADQAHYGPSLKKEYGTNEYSYYKNALSQIEWGLDYIHRRYGNPTKANRFWHKQCKVSQYGCWY